MFDHRRQSFCLLESNGRCRPRKEAQQQPHMNSRPTIGFVGRFRVHLSVSTVATIAPIHRSFPIFRLYSPNSDSMRASRSNRIRQESPFFPFHRKRRSERFHRSQPAHPNDRPRNPSPDSAPRLSDCSDRRYSCALRPAHCRIRQSASEPGRDTRRLERTNLLTLSSPCTIYVRLTSVVA